MLKCEGIVEYHLRDAKTGELIEKKIQTNQLSWVTIWSYLQFGEGFGPNIGITSDSSIPRKDDLVIRVNTQSLLEVGYVAGGFTSPIYTAKTATEPANVLFTNRFDQPPSGQTRTIKSIFLTPATAANITTYKNGNVYEANNMGNWGLFIYPPSITQSKFEGGSQARVKLETPCIQTDTQVLDIYYRVKFILPPVNNTAITSSFLEWVVKKLARQSAPHFDFVASSWSSDWPEPNQSHPGSGFIRPFLPYASSVEPSYDNYGHVSWDHPSSFVNYSRLVDHRIFRTKFSYSMALTDNIGRILGTMYYGSNWTGSTATWHTVLPPNPNPNSKMQPVHNHGVNGTLPFIDINNLALGQGTIVPTNISWANKDYPEMYRVEIHADGEPNSSATYTFQKRNHFGFNFNSYQNRPELIPWMTSKENNVFEQNHGIVEHTMETTTNGYGAELAYGYNALRFDYTSIVTSDKTGVQWTSTIKPQSMAWDATTTPSLPATYIHQMAVSGSKIWVACRNTGLYVIDKDLNTVTKMNIPGVNDKCYGVDIGYNNSIWAVMDGGIVGSTNGGFTWTVYNPSSIPAFTFTGISDSNWNSVAYIRVDPSSVDNQMLLIRDDTTTINQTTGLVWWSTTTTATAGYVGTQAKWIRRNKQLCDVSDKGWWIGGFENGNNDQYRTRIKQLIFNSATVTDSTLEFGWQNAYQAAVMFDELPTGDEVLIIPWATTGTYPGGSTTAYRTITMLRRYSFSQLTTYNNLYPSVQSYLFGLSKYAYRPIYLGKGIMTYTRSPAGETQTVTVFKNQQIGVDVLNENPLGGSFGKLVWEDYRWNGSTWQKEYHAPLIDSSGNNSHGIRKLFKASNAYFQGHDSQRGIGDGYTSHVDISNVVSSGFSSQLTFAATIASPQVSAFWSQVFEIADGAFPGPSTNKFLIGWSTDVANTIGIWSGVKTEFGVRPSDGLTHRLVITANGTTVKCYLDGIQFGTTKTISNIPYSTAALATIGASRNGRYVQQPFQGSMTNIQIWNKEWTGTDAAYDYANQTGLISDQVANSITIANLKAWYKNDTIPAESKVCHTSSDTLIEGINLAFTAGSIGTSFKNNDYYTFGAVNGVWKDNATTYSGTNGIYMTNVVKGVTDIENPVVSIIPAITVPELVTDWDSQGITPAPTINIGTGKVTLNSKNTGVVSHKVFYGDFEVTFTDIQVTGLPAELLLEFGVGLISNSEFDSWQYKDFFYQIKQDLTGQFGKQHKDFGGGSYGAYWNVDYDPLRNGGYAATSGTRTATDVFKFKRVGDTITLYLNGTLISTTNNVKRKGFVVKMRAYGLTTGNSIICPTCTIVTAAASPPLVLLGNKNTRTGIFDPDFLAIDADSTFNAVRNYKFNGVDIATRYWSWDFNSITITPVINEILVLSSGIVICNAADIGKTLSLTYDYVKQPI